MSRSILGISTRTGPRTPVISRPSGGVPGGPRHASSGSFRGDQPASVDCPGAILFRQAGHRVARLSLRDSRTRASTSRSKSRCPKGLSNRSAATIAKPRCIAPGSFRGDSRRRRRRPDRPLGPRRRAGARVRFVGAGGRGGAPRRVRFVGDRGEARAGRSVAAGPRAGCGQRCRIGKERSERGPPPGGSRRGLGPIGITLGGRPLLALPLARAGGPSRGVASRAAAR